MRDIKLGDRERHVARIDRKKRPEWKQKYANRKSDISINRCTYCRLKKMHQDCRSYPAYGKTCDLCHKSNHFASVCRADRYRNIKSNNKYDTKEEEKGLRKL